MTIADIPYFESCCIAHSTLWAASQNSNYGRRLLSIPILQLRCVYEVDPLTCTGCGKKIKITAFITNEAQIHRILRGIRWPAVVPEFDPPYDPVNWDICDLVPDTHDGFPEPEQQVHCDIGPDPPHCEDISDPPHWED